MKTELEPRLRELLSDRDAVRVLVTCGPSGAPHAVVGPALEVDVAGRILYLEPLEASRTQRDLVSSLWFDRPVAIVVVVRHGTTWRIGGRVRKSHLAGPVFRERYVRLSREQPGSDLAAVWEIAAQEISDETPTTLRKRQDAERPFFRHLDRIARPQPGGRPL
jgi:hypothetical protein